MSTSADVALERLVRPFAGDAAIDREGLAGLLIQLARNLEPRLAAEPGDLAPIDPRLEQLRTVLVGREIEVLSRLREVVEDPEQLAVAVNVARRLEGGGDHRQALDRR